MLPHNTCRAWFSLLPGREVPNGGDFPFAITLTAIHQLLVTIATQILSNTKVGPNIRMKRRSESYFASVRCSYLSDPPRKRAAGLRKDGRRGLGGGGRRRRWLLWCLHKFDRDYYPWCDRKSLISKIVRYLFFNLQTSWAASVIEELLARSAIHAGGESKRISCRIRRPRIMLDDSSCNPIRGTLLMQSFSRVWRAGEICSSKSSSSANTPLQFPQKRTSWIWTHQPYAFA